MLTLTLRPGERVVIEGGIVIEMLSPASGHTYRVGFTAPKSVGIWREKLCPAEHLPTDPPRTVAKS